MRKFWSTLALQLGKRAGLVSIIGLAVTLLLGLGITQLQFSTSQDSYLNYNDKVAVDNRAYQGLFGGELMVSLLTMDEGHTVAELTTNPHNYETIQQVAAELRKSPHIQVVATPIDGLVLTDNLVKRDYEDPSKEATDPTKSIANVAIQDAISREDPGSPAAEARQADFQKTAERLLSFPADAEQSITDPEWVDLLLHDNEGGIRKALSSIYFDNTHAQILVRLNGNADIDEQSKGADAVKAAWEGRSIEGGTVTITGAPVLLQNLNDYLRGGILTLGGIALAIMVVILLLFFKVRWPLLPLAVIVVGVIWAFGLAGYLGISLSVVTIAGLPVMLGVGIDYAIQMHARVEEEVVIERASHPIQETARNLSPALLVVTFDAVFAFLALRFAKVPMIRDFGLLLAVGIVAICMCSIVGPLAALGIREYKSPTKGRDFSEGPLGRLVVWLGSLPFALAPMLAVLSLAVFLGGLAVEGQLNLQTDPKEWINQESQARKDLRILEDQVDASSELGIFVTTDDADELFSDEMASWMDRFAKQTLDEHPEGILRASSIATPIGFTIEVEGATPLPPTGEQVRKTYEVTPEPLRELFVNPGGNANNVIFITRPGSLNDLAVTVDEINGTLAPGQDLAPPEGVDATPSGLAVVGVGLLENLESNRVLLTYLAIAFVFLFLLVRLWSPVRALLSLVPVMIATGLASLIAWVFNLKLSPMTAVGGPLIVALCTEFTSLILLRFVEERGRGLEPRSAIAVTASRTGRAFIVSAMTATTGVAVIALSSLPLLRNFGIVVGLNTIIALTSALVILPPLLVWADQDKRRWVSKRLVPGDVLDRATRTRHDHDHSHEPDEAIPLGD